MAQPNDGSGRAPVAIVRPTTSVTSGVAVTQKLVVKEETIAKNILRHFVIGGELNPFRKNLYIRGGFNFQRRFDLVLDTYPIL